MSEQQKTELIIKRGQIKASLTRFSKFVREFDANKLVIELQTRLKKAEVLFEEFESVQSQLELIDVNTDYTEDRESFENSYFDIISRAEVVIKSRQESELCSVYNTTPDTPSPSIAITNANNAVKLPKINLPDFDGKYENYPQFSDTFNALINNNPSLSNIQKFYYLKSCLKSEAAKVIESLEVSEVNYETAFKLLQERFENKKMIIHAHVKALFEFVPINKESHQALRKLVDEYFKHIRALKNLGQPVESWDTLLIYLITTKLDPASKRKWEEMSIKNKDIPKIDQFTEFLKGRCDLLEALNAGDSNINKVAINKHTSSNNNYKRNTETVTCFTSQNPFCIFCKGTHFINNCSNLIKLSVNERYAKIKDLKACTNCLRIGHTNIQCKSSLCRKCKKRHNTILCLSDNKAANEQKLPNVSAQANLVSVPGGEPSSANHDIVNAHSSLVQEPNMLLSTALILIKDCKGNVIEARALLDVGSQSHFITTELYEKLGLRGSKTFFAVTGINQSLTNVKIKTEAIIKSRYNAFTKKLSFLVLNKITQNIPSVTFDSEQLKIPEELKLADPNFNESQKIDVLLGAGVFWELLCVGQIKINEIIINKTKLGWVVAGPIPAHALFMQKATICNVSTNASIYEGLENFWTLEEYRTSVKCYTPDEQTCENIFISHYERNENGRFIVALPMRENPSVLGDSLKNATNRFLSLEKRLNCNVKTKHEYTEFMEEYARLGHMTQIPENEISNTPNYYLPHHGVLRENSLTTRLRVVFDASCKSESGKSLNDILLVGPKLQENLFTILICFRKHNFVMTADIEKMYRQVEITNAQRDLQRIVWRSESQENLKHFRLNTVTYGTAPASFLAVRCLQELAKKNERDYPEASMSIQTDFYMDDWLAGSDTIENAIKLRKNVSNILASGGFQLRKWVSNEKSILQDIVGTNVVPEYYIPNDTCVKTLGLYWNSESDSLHFSINFDIKIEQVTKRHILSTISKIFDPLGLITPIIIKAKIILQQLWQLKLAWDESVPVELYSQWVNFLKNISLITKLRIPRQIMLKTFVQIQLHGFSDASQAAYGACLYVRTTNSNEHHCVRLLCSKSRVAPLKKVTLPRLELCAALLLAQLAHEVIKSLNIEFTNIYYYSDSTIVLSWLSSPSNNWKTFVSNRVAEIQELSLVSQWRHVRTHDNPADLITRGMDPSKLLDSTLWFSGPPWLSQNTSEWQISEINPKTENEIPEKRNIVLNCVSVNENELFVRYSSLSRLTTVIAYCLRFKNNLTINKGERIIGPLTPQELNIALITLIRVAQSDGFKTEIRDLKASHPLSSSSRLLSLNPFLDQNNVIRVGGRLAEAKINYDQKFPIVLPDKHPLTRLIINYEHIRHLHAGPQLTLAAVRQRFWPLRGRSEVKKYLRQCVRCFKVSPKGTKAIMGELPDFRVTKVSRPFYNTGLDYAGPFLVKDGKTKSRKIIKCYLCIFICLSTKAVHLELAGDLTSESFLNALKRFISRRGICKNMYSDNATNFVGANKLLQQDLLLLSKLYDHHDIINYFNENSIRWHFIPARSPHFGGLWEAAVKSAKGHLKRVLGNSPPIDFELLYTLVVQVEAVLNSRPLTPLSPDPSDLQPLTPGHFLIGDSITTIPQIDVSNIQMNRLTQFKRLQQMFQSFWQRWSREYLSGLQQRAKWKKPSVMLKVGELVLLRDENTPPLKWNLGRIIEVHPGKDNVVRVVTVKTAGGTFQRAVNKVCVLPLEDN